MQIQTTEIEDEHQHFLDSAVECGDIDSASTRALELYGDRRLIADLIDSKGVVGKTREICSDLVAAADAIIADLPPLRRAAFSMLRVFWLHFHVRHHAEYICGSLYEDLTLGGGMRKFRKNRLGLTLDRMAKPTGRMKSRFKDRRYIRHKIKNYSDETRYFRHMATKVIGQVAEFASYDSAAIIAEINAVLADGARQRHSYPSRLPKPRVQVKPNERRKAVAQQRKVTKRAAVMAAGLLGASTVGAFARGESVNLAGKDTMLIVERAGALHALGHGKLRVSVATKTGEKLADLCVYFEDTPALDQLTGFALHAMAGEEAEIIKAANLTQVYPAGIDHPALGDRAKGNRRQVDLPFLPDYFRERRIIGEYRNELWHANGELWIEEVSAYVYGDAADLMKTLSGTMKFPSEQEVIDSMPASAPLTEMMWED